MTNEEFAVVFAMARCGIYCEAPTEAFLHQLNRLAEILSPERASAINSLLDWHNSGRVLSVTKFAAR